MCVSVCFSWHFKQTTAIDMWWELIKLLFYGHYIRVSALASWAEEVTGDCIGYVDAYVYVRMYIVQSVSTHNFIRSPLRIYVNIYKSLHIWIYLFCGFDILYESPMHALIEYVPNYYYSLFIKLNNLITLKRYSCISYCWHANKRSHLRFPLKTTKPKSSTL